jgi:ATP-dependent DNA ligase
VTPAAVFAFDLLQLRGKDLRALPLLKRKALLQRELLRTERIVYCQHVGESGEKLFLAADQLGLEGVIGKKADCPGRLHPRQMGTRVRSITKERIEPPPPLRAVGA